MTSNNVGQTAVTADLIIFAVKPFKPVAFVTSRDFTIEISLPCFINGIWKRYILGILVRTYSFNLVTSNGISF